MKLRLWAPLLVVACSSAFAGPPAPLQMLEAIHSQLIVKLTAQGGNVPGHAFQLSSSDDFVRQIHLFDGNRVLGQSAWWRGWQSAAPRAFVIGLSRGRYGVQELMVGLTIADAKDGARILEAMEIGISHELGSVGLATTKEGIPRATRAHDQGFLFEHPLPTSARAQEDLARLGLRAHGQPYVSIRLEELSEYETQAVYRSVGQTLDYLLNEGYPGILELVGRSVP